MSTIRVLALVGVLAAATTAHADYQTCMTHCMTQHDFDHCHPICAGTTDRTDDEPAARVEPLDSCLLTDEEQGNLVHEFMEANYPGFSFDVSLSNDNHSLFEVAWSPTEKLCRGVVRLNADCEVLRHEKFHCQDDEVAIKAREAEQQRRRTFAKDQRAIIAHVRSQYPGLSIAVANDHGREDTDSTRFYRVRLGRDGVIVCVIDVAVQVNSVHLEVDPQQIARCTADP